MFNWFKCQKETPAAVRQAAELEHDIRNQLTAAEAEVAYEELAGLASNHPEHPDIRRLQANAALNLLRLRSSDGTTENGGLVEGVQSLADLHPAEGILRECLVHLNWEYMASLPPDRLEESAAIHARQLDLYSAHAEVRQHADPVICSMMKLMTDYLVAGNIEAARERYDAIVSLAGRHPNDREVQIVRRKAAPKWRLDERCI